MPSSKRNLNPGDSTVFTTRVVGQQTLLTVIPWPPSPDGETVISWHKILCCESDHTVVAPGPDIDISAAGALVTVTCISPPGLSGAQVWTDYI